MWRSDLGNLPNLPGVLIPDSKLPPHDNYDGVHRWDPEFEWSPEEEAAVIRKADWKLLSEHLK